MRTHKTVHGRLLWGCAFILFILWGSGNAATVDTAPGSSAGYLENIAIETIKGKERITITVQNLSAINVERRAGNILAVVADKLYIPENLRKAHKSSFDGNVLHVTPTQTATEGGPTAVIVISLKRMLPYLVRQEGNSIIVDFNAPVSETTASETEATGAPPKSKGDTLVTINLQESTVKEALELFSLLRPDISIVSTDDVDLKGKITVHLKNMTWNRALDTVLKIKDLEKIEDGHILIISTVKKIREDEAARQKVEEERKKREEKLREEEQKKKSEEGGLRQVSIEAKIVEVNESFTRNLGVQWAVGSSNYVGSYPVGVLAGTNPTGIMDTSATPPVVKTLSAGVALTQGALAVNFPLAFAPSIGIVTGSAYSVFSAQLSALEKTSRAKLISAPRVTTMDGESANIEQGEQIPVVTPATANNPASTTYKDAVLKLTVKPRITGDQRIALEVKASNDRPNKADKDPTGNMPIFKNTLESKVVVGDGDTLIIGGIFKTEDSRGTSGFPWLSRIPILGWLFKAETLEQSKGEIVIAVTPRIIKPAEDIAMGRKP